MTQKSNFGVGLDVGTMNIVSARRTDKDKVETSRVRDAFLDLDLGAKKMLKLSGVNFINREDGIIVVGDAALEMANVFGREARRPLSAGLVSAGEIDALEVLGAMIKNLLGAPKKEGEVCYFSVPAAPVDDLSKDVVYHKGVFERIVSECGYQAVAGNEAMAIIYAECAKESFSGLSISFGSGMCNCLAGDTLVPLLDGTERTLEDLASNQTEPFWVYSCREDGQIVPGLAHHPRKTGEQEVLRVTFDNGLHLELTADHLVQMRDGTYRAAGKLDAGDSVMPLYLDNSGDKYTRVKNNLSDKWNFVHCLVAHQTGRPAWRRKGHPNDEVIHHKNFKHSDNRPENLEVMTRSAHSALHAHLGDLNTEGLVAHNKKRRGKSVEEVYGVERGALAKASMSRAKIGRSWVARLGSEGAQKLRARRVAVTVGVAGKYERTPEIRMKVSEGLKAYFQENPISGKPCSEETRKKISQTLTGRKNGPHSAETRRKISEGQKGLKRNPHTDETKAKMRASHAARRKVSLGETGPINHKVTSVVRTGKVVAVYDLTVDEYHNFGTSAGVFVHNCALSVNGVEGFTFSVARGGDWIDAGASKAVGSTQSRMCALKEQGVDLLAPKTREQEALALYYKALIEYCIDNTAREFQRIKDRFSLPKPIPLVVSGGTSLAGNFLEFFKQTFEGKRKKFPVQISEIRQASDPMNAVARGLLIQAIQEQDED